MQIPDFHITAQGPVSRACLSRQLHGFKAAAAFIKQLPYARNKDKTDLLSVFTEHAGTCSTKHSLLWLLARENACTDLRLQLGIFKMNGRNTPAVKVTLDKHGLEYIPEAHMYLRCGSTILDYTTTNSSAADFEEDLMEERELFPEQITDYKVSYHRRFLEAWLVKHPELPYSLDDVWAIREQCILDLYTYPAS